METRFICTYAREEACYEICRHIFPHAHTYGCEHHPCPHEAAKCLPFVGNYFLERQSGGLEEAVEAEVKSSEAAGEPAKKGKSER